MKKLLGVVAALALAATLSPTAGAAPSHPCESDILLFTNYPINPGPTGCLPYIVDPSVSLETHWILPGATHIDMQWAVDKAYGPAVPGRLLTPSRANPEVVTLNSRDDDVLGHRYVSDRDVAIAPTEIGTFYAWTGDISDRQTASQVAPDYVLYFTPGTGL